MTTGEYQIARPPHDESEHVVTNGDVRSDLAKVSVKLEVFASSEDELIERLRQEIADREIDPDECVGLQGFSESYETKYPDWNYSKRLGPTVAVIWHPDAIVPPCTVLQSDAIIYGAVKDE